MTANVQSIMATAIDITVQLGELRFMSMLEGITHDEPDDDRGEDVIHPEDEDEGGARADPS